MNSNIVCNVLLEEYIEQLRHLRSRRPREPGLIIALVHSCQNILKIYYDLDLAYAQELVVAALCRSIGEAHAIGDVFTYGNQVAWNEICDWVYHVWGNAERSSRDSELR